MRNKDNNTPRKAGDHQDGQTPIMQTAAPLDGRQPLDEWPEDWNDWQPLQPLPPPDPWPAWLLQPMTAPANEEDDQKPEDGPKKPPNGF